MRPAVRGVLDGEPGKLRVEKGHCRGCAKPVPKGRRSWCSDECVQAYLLRHDPKAARAAVFERDKGRCALCGRDCAVLEEKLRAWIQATDLQSDSVTSYQERRRRCAWARRCGVKESGGYGFVFAWFRSLWDADHIRPVVEGGGGCSIENLRTLCVCCHKGETKKLAARRAEARRRARLHLDTPLRSSFADGPKEQLALSLLQEVDSQ